jgi:hypothetical protein
MVKCVEKKTFVLTVNLKLLLCYYPAAVDGRHGIKIWRVAVNFESETRKY